MRAASVDEKGKERLDVLHDPMLESDEEATPVDKGSERGIILRETKIQLKYCEDIAILSRVKLLDC